MTRDERIKQVLQVLKPIQLELVNNSADHGGHNKEASEFGDTHYRLVVVSEFFNGLSRLERQQKVYQLLSEEFKAGLHALELRLLSPQET